MLISQEPKYDVTPEGRIINRASGEIIPDDEPIFIFRARDTYALSVLLYYAQSLSLESEHQRRLWSGLRTSGGLKPRTQIV
jgi:hypothetical protein